MENFLDDVKMENYINLAKRYLVHARIARQKATVAEEMAMHEGHNDFLLEQAKVNLKRAEEYRQEARALLREVERNNGARYMVGERTFPLKDYLVGKFFKTWDNFDAEYARVGAPFFGGDPE